MTGIVDIHAHILPGIDDGARSMEEACQMLSIAAKQGICKVIATPHEIHKGQVTYLQKLAVLLEEKVKRNFSDVKLYLGQENFYHEDLSGQLDCGEALTMAGSRYVLIEFAPGVSYREMYRAVRKLLNSGYWPILAHMERYRCLRNEENLDDLRAAGCLMQMNYSGLSGPWFRSETRWKKRKVLTDKIDFLGTDMHRLDYRPPKIEKAVKWLEGCAGKGIVQKIMIENPHYILNGEWTGRRK